MSNISESRFKLTKLRQITDVSLPTKWANFRLLAFEGTRLDHETRVERSEIVLALVLGDIHRSSPVDCHDQFHLALRTIVREGAGILIYEHQEGRGIGLMEKLRAYELQDRGLDTIEANLRLGHAVDLRDYVLSVCVLKFLKIPSIRLISNNPDKVNAVRSAGIEIVERLSADVPGNAHSLNYLSVKRDRLGHLSRSAETLGEVTSSDDGREGKPATAAYGQDTTVSNVVDMQHAEG
jgi:GTP cyclohydrolase II